VQQLNEFKRLSLTPIFFEFIKNIIGDYKFILPIDSDKWSKLLSVKKQGYSLPEEKKELSLNIDDYTKDIIKNKEKNVEEFFGKRESTNE